MCGGKSKSTSSTASAQTTTATTGTATGTVGSVYQGQTVNITDQFPAEAVAVFNKLIDLAGDSLNVAAGAGDAAIKATNTLATSVKQPDVAVVQGYQKQTMYAIAAAVVVAGAFILRK